MGYFTWTLANRTPTKTKTGEYTAASKLRYGGYGAIVCPDNTIIAESCYEGYGEFGGKDVYELVVDWNKDHLVEIPKLPGFLPWGDTESFHAIMEAFQKEDKEALQAAIDVAAAEDPFMKTKWKRVIGIYIACKNNHLIPFPIRIVDCVRPKPYAELRPSISTQ